MDALRALLTDRFGVNAYRAEDEGFSEVVINEIMLCIEPLFQAERDRAERLEAERQHVAACVQRVIDTGLSHNESTQAWAELMTATSQAREAINDQRRQR